MSISDISAMKKWNAIPPDTRKLIVDTTYCRKCISTTIIDYSITDKNGGLLLSGHCQKCGLPVARFVEDE